MEIISTSREEIRQKLLEEYAKILLVNSEDLDQSDSAFNTYVLNALSYLMADALFYGTIVYRESIFITAQLPESIINWAIYLDYTPRKATAAEVGLLIELPIEQAFTAKIPKGHPFRAANNIIFRSKYDVMIDVSPSGSKKVEIDTGSNIYAIPISVSSINNVPYMSFVIDAIQYDIVEEEFTIPTLNPYEYYYKQVNLPESDDNVLDIEVYINNELWTQKKLVLLAPNEKGYEAIIHKNSVELLFGNGYFGKQPSGNMKVIIKTTKGSKGNVIPGTITTGDPLVCDFDVKYSVINPESAKNGSDFEDLNSIKRNAINSLKMLRRLVSEEDFQNIQYILGLDQTVLSKPILKRSDLACNDVYVYIAIDWNNRIVPTHTIPVDSDASIIVYKPFSIFTYEGREWYCPFEIHLDFLNKLATFYYLNPRNIFELTKIFENSANHLVSKLESRYKTDTDEIEFICYIIQTSPNIIITFSQELVLESAYSTNTYTPVTTETLEYNIIKFTYRIPRSQVLDVRKITVNTYEDTGSGATLTTQYETNSELIFSLKEITYSHIIDHPSMSGWFQILDIPVIEKEFFDNLTDSEKDQLQIFIITQLMTQVNSYNKRLMNVHVSGKFAKTLGITSNTQFSTPDYFVVKIVDDIANLPDPSTIPGQYVALSNLQDPTSPWYIYSGHLLISNGSEYKGLHVGRGTMIRSLENPQDLFVTDGRRWIKPLYPIPLNFVVEIHSSSLSESLLENVKDVILNYVNNIGIEGNLYLSKVTDLIHNLREIKYCRIIKPETDIIYKDIIENQKKEQFYYYTPEYLYTIRENITLIPVPEHD